MVFGILLCLALGLVATWMGSLQHVIGAPLIGMFLGMLLMNLAGQKLLDRVKEGVAFSSKVILRLGIILCGGTLSFATIVGAGSGALPYILLSIGFAFLTACLVGKYLFSVSANTRIMMAGGTSICGGTAIATLSAVLDADEDETGYAMTAIFLFDILATLIWPYVAMGMGFSPEQFSILAGIAINDVASVTAAGATYDSLMGAAAYTVDGVTGGDLAVVVKLTRVVMLVFVALGVMIWNLRRQRKESEGTQTDTSGNAKKVLKAFPVFILGFLALALVNTLVDFSTVAVARTTVAALLKVAYKFLITTALVGVGCKISLKSLFTKGIRPVLLGGCTWGVVAIVTFSYVTLFM
ncbi:MAG: putative sulfate exporter family transporter [Oscillospiraceae bacterium]|nr:putative sulfate exporter family transporter [Oscillospiraceae bacterium]